MCEDGPRKVRPPITSSSSSSWVSSYLWTPFTSQTEFALQSRFKRSALYKDRHESCQAEQHDLFLRLCSLDPLPKPPFYLSVIVQVDQNRSTTQIERCNGTVSRAGKDMYNDIAEVGVLLDEIPVKPERKGPPREVFHI